MVTLEKRKFSLKIPPSITAIYSKKKKLLTIIGDLGKKSLKLKTQLRIADNGDEIQVTQKSFTGLSNADKSKLPSIKGTTVAQIKRLLIDVLSLHSQKMRFIGVGYRSYFVKGSEKSVIRLKLGLSHFLYLRVPEGVKAACRKFTKLFVHGGPFAVTHEFTVLLRSCKRPEPYKGKGIRYLTETIPLKEGKKVK